MIYDAMDFIQGIAPPGAKILCPFHDDGNASATIFADSNVFFCFRCRIRADQIDVARRLWFPDTPYHSGRAMAELALREQAIPLLPASAQAAEPQLNLPTQHPATLALMTAWCDLCAQNLARHATIVRRLCDERGMRDPVKLGIGLASYPLYLKFVGGHLREEPTWLEAGEELLIATGISRLPDPEHPFPWEKRYRLDDRLILPERRLIDGTEQVIYYQARAQEREHRLRYLNPRGMPRPLYGWRSLANRTPVIWLVEGVFDQLPLAEAGQAAISINGLGASSGVFTEFAEAARGRTVLVAFDNDPPGADGVSPGIEQGRKRVAALRALGLRALLMTPPDPYKDVGEWVVACGVETLIAMGAAANELAQTTEDDLPSEP